MSAKPSLPQLKALRTVRTWAEHGTYMPFQGEVRSFDACVRKGLLIYKTRSQGSRYNGYALTEAGAALLENSK